MSEGKVKNVRSFIGNVTAGIICVLAALFLWYFVSENDTAQFEITVSGVPVTIKNESNLSVLSGDDLTVDVTVSGRRSVVNAITRDAISAFTTVASGTEAGKNKLSVECELPDGVSLVSLSSPTVTVYLDNTTTASVPVRVAVKDVIIDTGYELGTAQSELSSVWVTGPETVVNTVAEARLTVSLGRVTKTVNCSGAIVLFDESGSEIVNPYITTSASTVNATIPVTKTREVPVDVSFVYGIFTYENCNVTVSPSVIRVKGDADAVDRVTMQYRIDEKTLEIPDGGKAERRITVSLPSGVTNASGTDEIVVTVEPTGISTRTFTVQIQSPNITNVPDGMSVVGVYSLNVSVRGDSATIEKIRAYNIIARVDLSGAAAGENERPVSFSFSQFEGEVFEVGTYTVAVVLTEGDA